MSCRCKGPFALFVMFILPSCDRVRINRTLNQMLSKEVVAPAALEKVQMDTIGSSSLDPRAKCILYIDSTECTSCRIGRLAAYSDLYRRSQESSAFDFVVVISPKAKERERAVSQIHYQIEFPSGDASSMSAIRHGATSRKLFFWRLLANSLDCGVLFEKDGVHPSLF